MPAELEQWIDTRVSRDGFTDAPAYLEALIARDRMEYEEDVARVRKMIEEGIASGIVDAEPEDILKEIIAGIPAKHG